MDSATVAVSWTGATLGTGQPASGYNVLRVRNSDGATFAACGTTPSAPTSGLACNDPSVVDGIYHYTVTALIGSWTAASAAGNDVTVVNDSSPPTISVTSVSPTPNGNGFNNSSPVVVNLSAAAGYGVQAITYTVDSEDPVTVYSSTAAVPVAGEGVHSITFFATDNTADTSATGSKTVWIDTSAPSEPSAPVVAASSDSGSSATDGITSSPTPRSAERPRTVPRSPCTTEPAPWVAGSLRGVYTISSSSLTRGMHSHHCEGTDLAGNLGPASVSRPSRSTPPRQPHQQRRSSSLPVTAGRPPPTASRTSPHPRSPGRPSPAQPSRCMTVRRASAVSWPQAVPIPLRRPP